MQRRGKKVTVVSTLASPDADDLRRSQAPGRLFRRRGRSGQDRRQRAGGPSGTRRQIVRSDDRRCNQPASNPAATVPCARGSWPFATANRRAYPDFFNAPVPIWSGTATQLVIVRSGAGPQRAPTVPAARSPATMPATCSMRRLKKAGLAEGEFEARADDSLTLTGATIVNAVRCVPPENKPVGARDQDLPAIPRAGDRGPIATRCSWRSDVSPTNPS